MGDTDEGRCISCTEILQEDVEGVVSRSCSRETQQSGIQRQLGSGTQCESAQLGCGVGIDFGIGVLYKIPSTQLQYIAASQQEVIAAAVTHQRMEKQQIPRRSG